jgi:hypothetical protein
MLAIKKNIVAILSLYSVFAGLGLPQRALASEPLQTESGWTYLPAKGYYGPFRQFRKYHFDGEKLLNVIILNCSKREGNPYSNITFVLPPWYEIRSFPRSSWFAKFQFRIVLDGKDSIGLVGEYRKGEIFFDRTPEQVALFRQIILADSIDLAFGNANDIISYVFTEKVDGLMADPDAQVYLPGLKGMKHFARHEVFEACKRVQQGR